MLAAVVVLAAGPGGPVGQAHAAVVAVELVLGVFLLSFAHLL